MSLAKEFKEFISRGNVVDLAVGVIIGGAFGGIVTSLVKDVIMPPIGYMMSGIDFSSLKVVIAQAVMDASGKVTKPEVAIGYGAFKAVNSLKRKEAEAPAAPPAPTTDQQLLMEIRDLLAKR
jgi:large conductance mechanosensitive channel